MQQQKKTFLQHGTLSRHKHAIFTMFFLFELITGSTIDLSSKRLKSVASFDSDEDVGGSALVSVKSRISSKARRQTSYLEYQGSMREIEKNKATMRVTVEIENEEEDQTNKATKNFKVALKFFFFCTKIRF